MPILKNHYYYIRRNIKKKIKIVANKKHTKEFLNSFLLYLLSTILIPFYNNWHIDNCFSFSFKLDFTLLDISQPHIKHSSIINQDIINQDDFYNSIQGV